MALTVKAHCSTAVHVIKRAGDHIDQQRQRWLVRTNVKRHIWRCMVRRTGGNINEQ